MTESEERRRLLSDPHSPGEFRVNGIVRNVDAWYDAFGVKPDDKLYLDDLAARGRQVYEPRSGDDPPGQP